VFDRLFAEQDPVLLLLLLLLLSLPCMQVSRHA
jgi:hypothetical protein